MSEHHWDYVQRQHRNDESRNRAEHFREPWTAEEDELLTTFWGHDPEDEVAEALGRTIEACRQRFYMVRRGEAHSVEVSVTKTTSETTTVTYHGVHDDPDDQWWSPEYYK